MKRQNYQWYILKVRSGREEKVIEEIKSELEKKGWSNYLQEFKVIVDDQQKNILKGGYILCRCDLTSELVNFFYQIPEVVGFLDHQRSDNKPPGPFSEAAVNNFLAKVKEKKENKSSNYEKVDLNVGDLVKITEGIFVNREGRIAQLDKKKQKARVIIESSGWEISDVPVNICQKVVR